MSAINELGVLATNYFVHSLWQIPALLVTGWIVAKLFEKLGPSIQHSVWIAVLVLAVIVPAGSNRLPSGSIGKSFTATVQVLQSVEGPEVSVPWYTSLRLKPEIYLVFLAAYSLLTTYWIGRFLWSLRRTRLLHKGATEITPAGHIEQLWSEYCNAFSLPTVKILSSKDVTGPITIGGRKPVLIVPAEFLEECSAEELNAVFGHECAHMQRQDFRINLICEAISLFIAYHPCMWLLKSRIAETRELICDANAAEKMGNSSSYARSLLRLATTIYAKPVAATPQGIGMFDANILERRIMSLMRKNTSLGKTKRLAILVPGILLLSFISITAYAFSIHVDEQGSGDSQAQRAEPSTHVYHIGNGVSAPKLLHAVNPEYPPAERKNGKKLTGTCLVTMIVDTNGVPQNLHIVRSLAPKFDENAVAAVRQYRFQPAIYQGKAVPVQISVEVNFKIY